MSIIRIYQCTNCNGEWGSLAMAKKHVCKVDELMASVAEGDSDGHSETAILEAQITALGEIKQLEERYHEFGEGQFEWGVPTIRIVKRIQELQAAKLSEIAGASESGMGASRSSDSKVREHAAASTEQINKHNIALANIGGVLCEYHNFRIRSVPGVLECAGCGVWLKADKKTPPPYLKRQVKGKQHE